MFELDHPATQAWKRTRLHELKLGIPPNLIFVPVNFERDSLLESLRNSGYRTEEPGFFSWLAVTQYLTRDAIVDTLRMVASMASGTEIIFEYYVPSAMLDDEDRQILKLYADWAAAQGEPHHTYFEPAELEVQVRKIGFPTSGISGRKAQTLVTLSNARTRYGCVSAHFMGARV